jgi:hypothetical protein
MTREGYCEVLQDAGIPITMTGGPRLVAPAVVLADPLSERGKRLYRDRGVRDDGLGGANAPQQFRLGVGDHADRSLGRPVLLLCLTEALLRLVDRLLQGGAVFPAAAG